MKIRNSYIALIMLAGSLLAGCVNPQVWVSDPKVSTMADQQLDIKLVPVFKQQYENGCYAFLISVTNKTAKDIELNWNKSLYIGGGQTSGGFMFEGVVYKDRNASKQPDVIFAGSTMTKTIYPNNLVSFTSGQYGGWSHDVMPAGQNGAYLSFVIDGAEVSRKVTTNLSIQQRSSSAKGN